MKHEGAGDVVAHDVLGAQAERQADDAQSGDGRADVQVEDT